MDLAPITKEKEKMNLVVRQVRDFVAAASAPATRRAYSSDWRQFEGWCEAQAMVSLAATPAVVACYVADQAGAGKKVSMLERALVAIARAHQLANLSDPTRHPVVRETMKGIRRRKSTTQKKAEPLLFESLKTVVAAMQPEKLRDVRDIAILCLGFMTGLRRSELVALDVADLRWAGRGLVVRVRRSKNDQVGKGRDVVVFRGAGPTCPVAAVKAWLTGAGIEEGPVFVRVEKVLSGYVRDADLWRNNVTEKFGQ